jgi:hypothetical protein
MSFSVILHFMFVRLKSYWSITNTCVLSIDSMRQDQSKIETDSFYQHYLFYRLPKQLDLILELKFNFIFKIFLSDKLFIFQNINNAIKNYFKLFHLVDALSVMFIFSFLVPSLQLKPSLSFIEISESNFQFILK